MVHSDRLFRIGRKTRSQEGGCWLKLFGVDEISVLCNNYIARQKVENTNKGIEIENDVSY